MNLNLLMPEIALAITAIAVIFVDLFTKRKGAVMLVSLLGVAVAGVRAVMTIGSDAQLAGNGLFAFDGYSVFFQLFFLALAFVVILVSSDYVNKMQGFHGEFHALLLMATLGAMLTASATDIISILLSIELMAVSFYSLVGFLKDNRGSESAIKYILLGAVNAAVLLFGLAMLFGFSGSTGLAGIAKAAGASSAVMRSAGLIFGLALVLAALGFKTAAVPFHMWAPDVYEGAPTPITLSLSTASKVAGFAVLVRVLSTAFVQPTWLSQDWGLIVAIISALTMTTGNLLAIPQTNIKRLLAYSSIAQAGYMLVAVAAIGKAAASVNDLTSSLLYFMASFTAAEVAVFGVVIIASRQMDADDITGYAGLGKRSPILASAMTLGLLSLMGLPPLAGFLGKFYVFSQAAQHGLIWLVIVAVINSVISAYYYLRIVKTMWMDEPANSEPITSSIAPKLALGIACLAVLILGIAPALFTRATEFGAKLAKLWLL
jgi:NADH-quinone oxidoreductase subunit N